MLPSSGGTTPPVRPVRILRVDPNCHVIVRFLAAYYGLLTHWCSGRSLPCPGVTQCPPAIHKHRTLWKGYAPVEWWDDVSGYWWCAVLEITEALEELLHARDLRGETWALSHPQAGKKAMPVVGFFAEQADPVTLRKAFDVLPVLKRFYHLAELPASTPNPVPRRTLMEPTVNDPPIFLGEWPPPEEKPASREQVKAFLDKARKELGSGRNGHSSQTSGGAGNQPRPSNGNGR